MMKKIRFAFLLPSLAACLACGSPAHPSAAVARGFMDAYYVKADLNAAAALADGLALEKVAASQALREGQAIDSGTHQPRVSLKLIEAKVEGESASYLYRMEFQPDQAAAVRKKALIRVRGKDGGVWKVTQFTDYDSDGQ